MRLFTDFKSYLYMRKFRVFLLKNFALFSSTRGYNIFLLIITQYIAALFFFSEQEKWIYELLDFKLHFLVFSSALSLSGGFLINNFYDQERDSISKPFRTKINNQISANSKLILYLLLNTLCLFIAYFASFKILLFFLVYQFLMWFYSHKLKKILFLNNFMYTILVSFPFFALLLYYNNFNLTILLHSFFLFILILSSDILKDFRSIETDVIYDYNTIPTKYNQRTTKIIITSLLLIEIFIAIVYSILFYGENGLIYYHLTGIVLILFFIAYLWKREYIDLLGFISIIFRLYVLLGVLSIPLLKYSNLIFKKFLDHIV